MKCTIPEISWHNREPVLSVDICSVFNEFYRLATGGGDSHVLIWQLNITQDGAVKVEVISDLTRHQRAVNVVRWSPSGQYLVSADDDANIIIWQLKTDNIPLLEGETNDKETWIVYKVLRGHKEDVYDICWSVDGSKLLSGSVDNTAILWDVNKGKMEHILSDHKGFVQGVTWDPKGQLIATLGTDRICRIFDTKGKQVKARIFKGKLPVTSDHYLYDKEIKYFYDDTFKSFYRRLQFSPDGSLLICPSGHIESEESKKILNATLIFTMDNLNTPAAILPSKKQCSTAVRCCPIYFELRESGPDPVIKLPYRMIIAIATDHDVILYDTQQLSPISWLQEIHYTRLTDLTWSPDGLLLTASSTDGFCALITFEEGELGVPYVKEESDVEESILNISGIEELEEDENVDLSNKMVVKDKDKTEKEEQKQKKSNFLLKWANSPTNVKKVTPLNGNSPSTHNKSTGVSEASPKLHTDLNSKPATINKLTPKRITPITIKDSECSKELKVKITPLKADSSTNNTSPVNKLVPRRIVPTKVESPINVQEKNDKVKKIAPKRINPIKVADVQSGSSKISKVQSKSSSSPKVSNQLKINQLIPKRITPLKVQEENGSDKQDLKISNEVIEIDD